MQLWPNGHEIVPLYALVSKLSRTLSPFHGLEDTIVDCVFGNSYFDFVEDTPAWKYQILGYSYL